MSKPPYRVPAMAEIAAVPDNGFRVVSTFSGCGGSCLGYRMAGFKVVWASEFIPAAADTYLANHPETILDTRDIRMVQPQEILDATGLKVGELDLFDGSPPCASFSTAGKREKGWGKEKVYSDTVQRTDDLFFEYTRLLAGLRPKVFVAENVSGLVKGTAKGYFLEILAKLKACGYRVGCKVLDAQWLGVPQARQRTIFIGVREDLNLEPAFPKPLPYRYSIRDALPWIVRGKFGSTWRSADRPSSTVSASMSRDPETSHQNCEIIESKVVQGPQGKFSAEGVDLTDRPSPTILATQPQQLFVIETVSVKGNKFELTDFQAPSIEKYSISKLADGMTHGTHKNRFNLIKPSENDPCCTVTAIGENPGAASVIHPTEKRKFAIIELKRICGFPDDFILTGSYKQRWERLGRAVPPVMMSVIAGTVRDEILRKISREPA